MAKRKYNIEERKIRKQTMIYETQQSWIKRNQPPEMKSEAEFICHLISLGQQRFQERALEGANHE